MAVADDALDIRSGGIVAVDTETLRAAASRLLVVASECDGVREILERARRNLESSSVWIFPPGAAAARAVERCRRLAADLHTMADTYEVAELVAAASVADAAGNAESAAALRGRVRAIVSADPAVSLRLAAAALAWRTEMASALGAHYRAPTLPGSFAPWGADALALIGVGAVGALGLGAVPAGVRLAGAPEPVVVRRIGAARATAPASVTQIVDRMPQGDARVRVERYTMPGGARQFMVYSAGTRTGGPKGEAWDGSSNVSLYARTHGASFDATMAAAADAGARPGDRVTLAGYSQGAMVASFVALSGEYEVPMLVTFGDPVQADVGDATLSVAVRHLDDPVAALAGGGHAAGTGAGGSFVASRASPGTALGGEGVLGQHDLDAYRDTARLLDASADPRMEAVRRRLDDLAGATSVEAFAYGASRAGAAPVAAAATGSVPLSADGG